MTPTFYPLAQRYCAVVTLFIAMASSLHAQEPLWLPKPNEQTFPAVVVPPVTSGVAAAKELEDRIRELEARLKTIEDGTASKDKTFTETKPVDSLTTGDSFNESKSKVTGGWTKEDGFFLRSSDDQFKLRITGQIQDDYRAYFDSNDRTDIDTFMVRRARFGLEANLLEFYEFRFLPDFGNGKTILTDAYFNMHYWDAFQVETGKFKQPFSYEQLIQDRFVPFMERSLIDQLTPQRDVGVMLHGQKLFGDRFDWGMAVSNGEQNGDFDTNLAKDYNFRVAVRPLRETCSWLENVQFGLSVGTGIEQEPATAFILKTPLGVPFFNFRTGVNDNGLRNRWSPEFAYFYQAFGLSAQYFHMDQQFATPNGKTTVTVPMDGYYIMTTLLLTGETRTTYSFQLDPLRPFDPRCGQYGPGAWELAGRVSRLHLSDDVFLPGALSLADPSKVSNGATEMTLGFNWYLNAWVRVQLNWEHSWFDRPVQLGPTKASLYSYDDALGVRVQIIF